MAKRRTKVKGYTKARQRAIGDIETFLDLRYRPRKRVPTFRFSGVVPKTVFYWHRLATKENSQPKVSALLAFQRGLRRYSR